MATHRASRPVANRHAHRAHQPTRPGRSQRLVAQLLSAAVLVTLFGGYSYIVVAEPGRSERAAQLLAPPSPSTGIGASDPPAPSTSPPVRLSIPSIGVDAGLQSLDLLPDGNLASPSRPEEAGWYASGVLPGNTGSAVIAGHVGLTARPAVFGKLAQLRVGDRIAVRRRDSTVVTFEVDEVHAYPTAQFPTRSLYAPTGDAVLRLISCIGDASADTSYLLNLVVTAHLVTS